MGIFCRCCKKKNNTKIENLDRNNEINLLDKNNENFLLDKNNELLENNNEILDNNNENVDKNKEIPFEKKLNIKDFERIKLLGKGSFGEVYLVKSKIDNKSYAMKIIDKKIIRENNKDEHTQIEGDLSLKESCPFIANIKFVFQDENNLYILTEFIEGNVLLLQLNKEKKFKNENAKIYLAEIILALDFLHNNNIIYRDLKPKNILLDNSGHIKLTNFGLSRITKDPKEKFDKNCGNSEYLAPEIFSNLEYDSTVDFWSLGCIFYEMLIGRSPYKLQGESFNEELYKKRVLIPDYINDEAEDLINKLLVIDSKKRLGYGIDGMNNIKKHPYFNDINWNDALNKKLIPPFIPHNVL